MKNDNLTLKRSIHYFCKMQMLKRIFDFYVFSNIHVALAVYCLTKITLFEKRIDSNLIPLFVLFSTIVSYNLIRFYSTSETQHWLDIFVKKNRKILFGMTLLSGVGLIYLTFQLQIKGIISLLPFGFFTLFYIIPLPFQKKSSVAFRNVALLKLFLIAISYAGVTVLFPLINYNMEIGLNETVIFIQRFLFIAAITIPFDIRDLKFDRADLKTIPQVLGIQKSKVVGLFFLMLFLGLEFFKYPNSNNLTINLIIAILSLMFILKSIPNQNKYYSAFFIEGLPIIWMFLVVFS